MRNERPKRPPLEPRPRWPEGQRAPGAESTGRIVHWAGGVNFLYEDDDIVAVNKPEGLPVIAPEGSRSRNLYDIVTIHIRRRNPKGRAAVVHRLDRDTSGVMIFAKNADTKKRLMENWNSLVRERAYTALVTGVMEGDSGTFDSWLSEDRDGRVRVTAPGLRGSLRAITRWKTIASQARSRFSLLELNLETGRKHQIRVQLAQAGHSIAGDERYGRGSDPLGRLALHAHLLVVEHPFSARILRLESPVPQDFFRAVSSGAHHGNEAKKEDTRRQSRRGGGASGEGYRGS